MKITSRHNPIIVELRSLLQKKQRDELSRVLIEGEKMAAEALLSGVRCFCAVYIDRFAQKNPHILNQLAGSGAEMIEVDEQVLLSLCDTKTPQGIVLCASAPSLTPPADYGGDWIALQDVQDPGNVGSIIRTADALGFAGALLSPACADPFSQKSLRASMGSVFHISVARDELAPQIKRFRSQGYLVIASHLHGESCVPLAQKRLLLIGNESKGLSNDITEAADFRWKIAMRGQAESLNAATAAAIMMYELTR